MSPFHNEIEKLALRMGVELDDRAQVDVKTWQLSILLWKDVNYRATFRESDSSLTLSVGTGENEHTLKLVIVPSKKEGKLLFRQYKGNKPALPAPLPLANGRSYTPEQAVFALKKMKPEAIRMTIVQLLLRLLEQPKE